MGGGASAAGADEGSAHPAKGAKRGIHEDDALDPSARHAAQLAPPGATVGASLVAPEAAAAPAASARVSLETLMPGLVRRVAWSEGDGKRRAMRVEIGEGALAGGALLVQAEDGRVHVRLDAPAHVDVEAWRERVAERLAKRGVQVDAIEVGHV
jgi:hypothetical protein